MIEIDLERAKQLLLHAVGEKGDGYRYTSPDGVDGSCYYVHHSPSGAAYPGCIAGNILYRAGVSLKDLVMCEGTGIGYALLSALGDQVYSTQEARCLLANAQHLQDMGVTWGDAYRACVDPENWVKMLSAYPHTAQLDTLSGLDAYK